MKSLIFLLLFMTRFFTAYSNVPDVHPTDHKFFEELLRTDPKVFKCYMWFGDSGEIYIYYHGTYKQIDSWHDPYALP